MDKVLEVRTVITFVGGGDGMGVRGTSGGPTSSFPALRAAHLSSVAEKLTELYTYDG